MPRGHRAPGVTAHSMPRGSLSVFFALISADVAACTKIHATRTSPAAKKTCRPGKAFSAATCASTSGVNSSRFGLFRRKK
eukprot:1949230-Alexandrium_andersonii.AAC.2